jgi:hypothetical protein
MKKYIQLKHGTAIIDEQDFDRINQYKWNSVDNDGTGKRHYATCKIRGMTVYMHRMVMGAQSGETVDHIDGNGLNNSRENLRFVVPSQNNMNQRVREDNTSGHKGISWCPDREKYQVYINVDRKRKSLGRYRTLEEAIYVRDQAAKKHYGEFARDNSSLPEDAKIEPHRAIPRTLRRTGNNNSSGKTGVTRFKGKWKATITVEGNAKHIGTFADLDLAIAAREKAEREYFPQYFENKAA